MSHSKPIICPTVTASEPHQYRIQMERASKLSKRVHIDLADGVFTDNKLISLDHIWWPDHITADIHLMYESIFPFMKQLIKLRPHMVIIQAESVGNFYDIAPKLNFYGIRVGISLLQHTDVNRIKPALKDIGHVLIFSGDLGHFGGHADLKLLDKVKQIHKLNMNIEIGWDGGINVDNIKTLVDSGVNVLNVGGSIHNSKNPEAAYVKLNDALL